jgi:hypothetical protein
MSYERLNALLFDWESSFLEERPLGSRQFGKRSDHIEQLRHRARDPGNVVLIVDNIEVSLRHRLKVQSVPMAPLPPRQRPVLGVGMRIECQP